MLYNRKFDRLIVLIAAVGFFVYFSTRPHLRLRANMPPEFVDLSPSMSPKKQKLEQQIAQQYWNCAQTSIQWKYTYGSALPDTPPEAFRITGGSSASAEAAAMKRVRYWHRLQKVWVMPSAWTMSHQWRMDWLLDPFRAVVDWLRNAASNAFSQG